MAARIVLLDEFEFQMPSLSSDLASIAVVVDVLGEEYRCRVLRSERLELLEYAQELRCNLREAYLCVDVHHRHLHLWDNLSRDEFLDSLAERRQVLLPQCHSGGVEVTSKILQKVRATLDGLVEVESRDTPC